MRRSYNGGYIMHGDVNTPSTGEGYQLGMLRIRRDGFVSVEGGYVFNVPLTQMPQFVTVPLLPPRCEAGTALALRMNFISGVAGFILAAVLDSAKGVAITGYSLEDADQSKGNYLDKVATWRRGQWQLPGGGGPLALQVALADASLFSLELFCRPA